MSGSLEFRPPIADLMIEIAERIGLDPVALTAQHYISMRRTLNLMQGRWSNRGINLWRMAEYDITLLQGVNDYAVRNEVMDIFDLYRRVGSYPDYVDTMLTPLSRNQYAMIPNKYVQGTPTAYFFNKAPASGEMTLYIWPAPDAPDGTYTLIYWALRRLEDAIPEQGGFPDVRWPFYEAWVAEASARFALKFAPEKVQMLAADAKDAWDEASQADTERVNLQVSPDLSAYFE